VVTAIAQEISRTPMAKDYGKLLEIALMLSATAIVVLTLLLMIEYS